MAAAMLLPEIEILCSEVDHAELAAAVAGQAQATAGLACILAFLPAAQATSAAYALGWSPAHVMGWMPYATAEAAAACRRALAQMSAAA